MKDKFSEKQIEKFHRQEEKKKKELYRKRRFRQQKRLEKEYDRNSW